MSNESEKAADKIVEDILPAEWDRQPHDFVKKIAEFLKTLPGVSGHLHTFQRVGDGFSGMEFEFEGRNFFLDVVVGSDDDISDDEDE